MNAILFVNRRRISLIEPDLDPFDCPVFPAQVVERAGLDIESHYDDTVEYARSIVKRINAGALDFLGAQAALDEFAAGERQER